MFLLSGAVPPSLADDIQRLEAAGREARRDNDEESIEDEHEVIQDWMLICQYNAEFAQSTTDTQDCDWSLAAEAYPDLLELPSFVTQQRQQYESSELTTKSADPGLLQGRHSKPTLSYVIILKPTAQAASP